MRHFTKGLGCPQRPLWITALLLMTGCTHARTGDARWEQFWPPGDGTKVDAIAPPDSAALGDVRAAAASMSSASASSVSAQPETGLSATGSAKREVLRISDDDRLTEQQRQLLAQQVDALAQQGPPATTKLSPADRRAVHEQPAGLTAPEPLRLANYVSTPSAKPALDSATAPASASPAANTPAAAPQPSATSADTSPMVAPPASPSSTPNEVIGSGVATEAPAKIESPGASGTPATTTEAATAPAASAPAANGPAATPVSSAVSTVSPATASPATSVPPAAQVPTGTEPSTGAGATSTTPSTSAPSSGAGAATQLPVVPTPGQWQQELDKSIKALEAELSAGKLDSNDRVRLEATLRLLYVAAQRRDDAVRTIEGVDSHEQNFWKMGLAGFFELLDPSGPPITGRRSKLALRYLREAVQKLSEASSLDVRNLAICSRVDSFGQYVEFEPYQFSPEQEVILYLEVSNFTVEEKVEGYETELQGSYQILDEAGRRLADYDLMLDRQVCRNIRTDYFLPYRVFLPKNLASGSYKIQVTLEDKKGKKFGQTPPVSFQMK